MGQNQILIGHQNWPPDMPEGGSLPLLELRLEWNSRFTSHGHCLCRTSLEHSSLFGPWQSLQIKHPCNEICWQEHCLIAVPTTTIFETTILVTTFASRNIFSKIPLTIISRKDILTVQHMYFYQMTSYISLHSCTTTHNTQYITLQNSLIMSLSSVQTVRPWQLRSQNVHKQLLYSLLGPKIGHDS